MDGLSEKFKDQALSSLIALLYFSKEEQGEMLPSRIKNILSDEVREQNVFEIYEEISGLFVHPPQFVYVDYALGKLIDPFRIFAEWKSDLSFYELRTNLLGKIFQERVEGKLSQETLDYLRGLAKEL